MTNPTLTALYNGSETSYAVLAEAVRPLFSGEVEQVLAIVNGSEASSLDAVTYLMEQVRAMIWAGDTVEAEDLARAVRVAQTLRNPDEQVYPGRGSDAPSALDLILAHEHANAPKEPTNQ